MSALICGSLAFDTIMVFEDRFKNHILPDQVHILNVAFLVPRLRREFGGCAGNIAYNLKLLGGDPVPMGTVGTDFEPYAAWMKKHGISLDHILEVSDTFTAQAYITTDLDDNQITAFHPGAMEYSNRTRVSDASGISVGIISPDGKEGMLAHAEQFDDAGIPFIFDPGQGLPMFDGEELTAFIEQATWVTTNDYESRLLSDRTGLTPEQIANRVEAYVVTRGGEGSLIYTRKGTIEVPAARVDEVRDPTGCGDAFRAGLLYGLSQGMDWEVTGRVASLMGAIKVEHNGTQNHQFTRDEFSERFKEQFGFAI
jgi:adenosine kinase